MATPQILGAPGSAAAPLLNPAGAQTHTPKHGRLAHIQDPTAKDNQPLWISFSGLSFLPIPPKLVVISYRFPLSRETNSVDTTM